jgi:hypothetical protein
MQLTTARLKQIIKEELEAITNELSDEEELLNEDMGASVAVITAITYGIGALVATGAAVGTIDTLKSLVQSLRNKKGQPLKEGMEVAQALLAAVSALTAIGASVGIIDTLKSLAEHYKGENQNKMEEAKKKAAKMSASGKAKVKNPYQGAESHKMKPMSGKRHDMKKGK